MNNLKKIILLFVLVVLFLPIGVFATEVDTDSIFRTIAPDLENAVFYMKQPTTDEEADLSINGYLAKYVGGDDYYVYGFCMGPDFVDCEIQFTSYDYSSSCNWDNEQNRVVCNVLSGWQHNYYVTASYEEPTSNSKVTGFINQLNNFDNSDPSTYYIIEDLSLINYYLTSSKSELWNSGAPGRALKYSSLNQTTKGSNVSYSLDVRAGNQDETLMFESAFGPMSIFYNGYSYGTKEEGLYLRRVLYIPSSTEDVANAYAAAAQERIAEYLGNNSVTVSYGGLISSLPPGSEDSDYPVVSDGNYYNVVIGSRTYKFYIVKGTEEQLVEPTYEGVDLDTNISVTSSDSSIPLDTSISVNMINDSSLKDKLGTDQYRSYDITLYSDAKGIQIENLTNGKFLVKIPVPQEYEGKDLTVYYVPTSGDVQEHEVTIQDGFAIFETDHFSIYTLAVSSSSNPKTFDKIFEYLSLFLVSVIGILFTGFYIKKVIFQ